MKALKSRHPRGICRYCRCTEKRACVLSQRERRASLKQFSVDVQLLRMITGSLTCSWINPQQNVCSNPSCVRKHRQHERAKRIHRRIRVRHGRQLNYRRAA